MKLIVMLLSVTLLQPVNADTYTDYIVQVPEWQNIEDEAVYTLESLGYNNPYLTSRNEIRAYLQVQVLLGW